MTSELEDYVACALWSSSCNGTAEHDGCLGEDCDKGLYDLGFTIDDLESDTLEAMTQDLAAFTADLSPEDIEQLTNGIGDDFWLTRNGHGAGFWDRGYPHELGRRVSDAARAYGACYLWVSEGKVYAG